VSYVERTYRRWPESNLPSFEVRIGQSDLLISADRLLTDVARHALAKARASLEAYLARDPDFADALRPHPILPEAPPLVREMASAARACGVGPMAAVAGAVAENVGRALLAETRQVIVENGGDIFLHITEPRVAAVFAGKSGLSGRLGIRIDRLRQPLGLCTSSGTVGPSLSFGRADAAIVLSGSAALADAAATALGNRVQEPGDIEKALDWLRTVPGVLGGAVIIGEQLGAWGAVQFEQLAPHSR
jgi:hypothetical protein